ncbi:MAG TPA: LapA family protein [Gaiellaceae bacterium]|nr:LapA family protein [Gaiellaceae bacterium]
MEGKPPSQPQVRRDIPWSLIGIAGLAFYALLIVLLNREEVAISFVFFSTRISKLVLILLCLGIGFAGGFLFDRWRERRREA